MNKTLFSSFYVMRHADFVKEDEGQHLSYGGVLSLRRVVDQLSNEMRERFPGQRLRVVHSTTPCARNTAVMMRAMSQSMSVLSQPDERLDQKKFLISKELIGKMVAECSAKNELCLFLSHEEDIETFCGKKLELAEYVQLEA